MSQCTSKTGEINPYFRVDRVYLPMLCCIEIELFQNGLKGQSVLYEECTGKNGAFVQWNNSMLQSGQTLATLCYGGNEVFSITKKKKKKRQTSSLLTGCCHVAITYTYISLSKAQHCIKAVMEIWLCLTVD